jgi:hypothetical protein
MKVPRAQLKILFADILRAYSPASFEGNPIFIKHLTNFDIADIDCQNESFLNKARERGMSTNQEREQELIRDGFWSESKNRDVANFASFIENAKNTRAKHFQKDLIREIDIEIASARQSIKKIENERDFLIGDTAEKFAAKKINEYYIFKSFYRDGPCHTPLFTLEEFNDLEDDQLNELVKTYNTKMDHFGQINLQRVALLSSFLNFFYLCNDDPRVFYGKPVMELTFYQAELFGFARYFKRILSELKTTPTEEMMDEPDKLITLHTGTQNVQKYVGGEGNVAIVGASPTELKQMGINTDNGIDLAREAKKRGKKTLSMEEIMEIQGKGR